MNCSVDRNQFAKAIDFVSQFTLVTSDKPILENIKLVVDHDSIVLSAYDGEAQAEVTVDCDSDLSTQLCVNALKLQKILKNCDSDIIELDISGEASQPVCLVVKNFDDQFDLPCSDGDLPALPSVSHDYSRLPTGLMARANSMSVAVDPKSARYQLGGVYFNLSESSIELASTDGRRMMYYHTSFDTEHTGQLIIPANVIKRIGKIGETDLAFNENLFLISSGNVKVAGRQIEGRFPNVTKVMESVQVQPAACRVVDRQLFVASLRRAELMTTDDSRGVELKACGRRLTLKSQSASVGRASVNLDCERETGLDNFKITLDSKLLKEMIESLSDSTVTFNYFGGSNAACFIGGSVQCVIMPMAVDKPAVNAEEEEATA